jgi:hypothetical protein
MTAPVPGRVHGRTAPKIGSLAYKMAQELQWLKRNPDFHERPASIQEFLGEDYLNIESLVRPGVRECLVSIFGDEPNVYNLANVQQAMFTGAIGIGKTTFASIALPYMCHWVLCLKDPQSYFDLLPGTRIAFMQMSTSERQARDVLFGDITARIKASLWFKKFPPDPKFTSQIRFPKDIWIVPGDSSETTFEGYNILGGIVDEVDSHKVTEKKDYAQEGYNTIYSRITSRFQNRGLLILIGQMKKSTGFASRMYEEFITEGKEGGCFAKRLTLWESFGWGYKGYLNDDGTRNSFWFDPKRKVIVPDIQLDFVDKSNLIEIPRMFLRDFKNNPEKALRDLAGIPPLVGEAFISMVDKVEICRDKWHARFNIKNNPTKLNLAKAEFEPWFLAPDTLKRVCHIDIAYSASGDALGFAMGHVRELKEIEGELKPVIIFDCLVRMRPLPGTQIILGDVRQMVYYLKDKLGFRIKKVTLDGFQSTDTLQQMQKKKIQTEYLSVDKDILPYHDLREAIYEERVEFPKYMTYMKHGDVSTVEIAVQELLRLIEKENGKIDHPEGGSKDVSDAMAGVVTTLMGDGSFRRGVGSTGVASSAVDAGSSGGILVPGFNIGSPSSSGLGGSNMPGVPNMPSMPSLGNLGSMLPNVPDHLRPR